MRTTIDIYDDLLDDVMHKTGAKSKKRAVELALQEYIRYKNRQELIKRIDSSEELNLTLDDLEKSRSG